MTWKCPKCGREFHNRNQDHYCVKPSSIDEYIAGQDESHRPLLKRLRIVIRDAIPEAEETISWSMPTFRKGRNLIHFAAFKNHIGLYPGDEAVTVFAKQLAGLDTRKGTIRIPYDRPLPEELISDIAKWCFEAYAKLAVPGIIGRISASDSANTKSSRISKTGSSSGKTDHILE